MLKVKSERNDKGSNTYIGKGTVITGSIECQGTLRVDGTVNGNASADNITIRGAVDGNLSTKGTLRILSSAKITGDINAGMLIAEKGGCFSGKCSIAERPDSLLEALFEDRRKKGDFIGNVAASV